MIRGELTKEKEKIKRITRVCFVHLYIIKIENLDEKNNFQEEKHTDSRGGVSPALMDMQTTWRPY